MTELTVLTYNVRGLRDDLGALVRVIRGSGAQLVCVQEAPKLFRWRSRAADLARRCGLVVVAGGAPAAGNLLLSDLAVTVHRTRDVRFPLVCPPKLELPQRRGAAVAELSLAGHRFTAVGTHLSLYPAERARQARRLLDLVPPDAPPAVLAGDFNEASGGAVSAVLAERLVDTAVAGGDPRTPTFSTASPRRRIDYVWADPGLAVSGYEVLDSADVRAASDHFPVRVRLDLG
ncbi:MAG TPA: endonuclease/exonuclease/phosphatase family protein [Mycobacteriales bacterium]|nr:endonuclease/exonuclease/phosphatase family protein [Mycobacteriales bacterium]